MHVRQILLVLANCRCAAARPPPPPVSIVECARSSVLNWNFIRLAAGVEICGCCAVVEHFVLHRPTIEHHLTHVLLHVSHSGKSASFRRRLPVENPDSIPRMCSQNTV